MTYRIENHLLEDDPDESLPGDEGEVDGDGFTLGFTLAAKLEDRADAVEEHGGDDPVSRLVSGTLRNLAVQARVLGVLLPDDADRLMGLN